MDASASSATSCPCSVTLSITGLLSLARPACTSHTHTQPGSSEGGSEGSQERGLWCPYSPAWPCAMELLPCKGPFPLPRSPSGPQHPGQSWQLPCSCQASGHQPSHWLPLRQRLRQCLSRMKCGPRSNYQGIMGWAVLGSGQKSLP